MQIPTCIAKTWATSEQRRVWEINGWPVSPIVSFSHGVGLHVKREGGNRKKTEQCEPHGEGQSF